MDSTNQLYEKFLEKFTGVDGECYRVAKADEIGNLLDRIFKEKGIKTISLLESPLTQEANLKEKMDSAGYIVHTDNLLDATSKDDAGITEVQWGIAELGTLVQVAPDVDNRLCSTLVPIHVALVRTSSILPELDDMLETIHQMPQIPGFIGFMSGPSRSSDIERILEIGVHGPEQVIAIFIDE